jgi:hypothetical protein
MKVFGEQGIVETLRPEDVEAVRCDFGKTIMGHAKTH